MNNHTKDQEEISILNHNIDGFSIKSKTALSKPHKSSVNDDGLDEVFFYRLFEFFPTSSEGRFL